MIRVIFVCLLMFFICPVLAEEVVLSEGTAISATNTSFENKSILVDGVNVVINGTHQFENIKIVNDGSITHDPGEKLDLIVQGVLEISNSKIDVTGKGLLPDYSVAAFSGGSHIGAGGALPGTLSALSYGDFRTPSTHGKGGRGDSLFIDGTNSTRGGGVVKIQTNKLILEDGHIISNGEGSNGRYAGGAAGGSILIDVHELIGNGNIGADGTLGAPVGGWYDGNAGDGSGGMVSIHYEIADVAGSNFYYNEFFGNIRVHAYGSDAGTHNYKGADGTVFLRDKTALQDNLFVFGRSYTAEDNDPKYLARTYLGNLSAIEKLYVGASRVALTDSQIDLNVDACVKSIAKIFVINDVDVIKLNNNDCNWLDYIFEKNVNLLNQSEFISRSFEPAYNESFSVKVYGNLTTLDNNIFVSYSSLGLYLPHVFNQINVNAGGVLTSLSKNNIFNPLKLSAVDFFVQEGGNINVSYSGGLLPECFGGLSYGGNGKSNPDAGYFSRPFGDYRLPMDLGIGCGGYEKAGGSVQITASYLLLNGSIYASGAYSATGGSIYLDVGRLESEATPSLQARAEETGGGGRIAVYYNEILGFDLSAISDVSGWSPGTLYYKNKTSATGTLKIKKLYPNIDVSSLTEISIADPNDHLIVENSKVTLRGITGLKPSWSIKGSSLIVDGEIVITDFPISENSSFIFNDDVEIGSSATYPKSNKYFFIKNLISNGPIVGGSALPFINVKGSILTPDGNLIVDGFTLELGGGQSYNNIEIKNGGLLTATRPANADVQSFTLSAANIFIDSTSKVDVTAKGIPPLQNGSYHGGSHGGIGGRSYYSNGSPMAPYGEFIAPTSYGPGSTLPYSISYGGGALKIETETMRLDGSIVANGEPLNGTTGGGAAGGSIWIDVEKISSSGSGKITANGSRASTQPVDYWGSYRAGGGGGGRVAIHYEEMEGFGIENIFVDGGMQEQGAQSGAPGTIYLHSKINNSDRKLFIKNSTINPTQAEQALARLDAGISLSVKNTNVIHEGDISLKGLQVDSSTVRVSGSFSLDGDLYAKDSSLNVYGNLNIQGDISSVNGSNWIVSGDLKILGDASLENSRVEIYQNCEWNNIGLLNSNISCEDANFKGQSNLTNSFFTVNNNLIAEKKVHLISGVSEIKIAVDSYSFFKSYININGDLVQIDEQSSETEHNSIRFKVARGLADAHGVSFESISVPGKFLTNSSSLLQLHENDHSEEFAKAATFYVVKAGNESVKLKSMSEPEKYIQSGTGSTYINYYDSSKSDSWSIKSADNKAVRLANLGALEVKGSANFWEGVSGVGVVNPSLVVAGSLEMPNNNAVIDGVSLSLKNYHSFNNFELKNSALLTMLPATGYSGDVRNGLTLVVNNAAVDANSKIDLSEKEQYSLTNARGVGGSHGGKGGNKGATQAAETHGDMEQPVSFGQSGAYDFYNKTYGGSAFKLTANVLDLNGRILTNGEPATAWEGAAAGGSIWLVVGSLTSTLGTGKIEANGGSAYGVDNSAGGGGRIAIYSQAISGLDNANITASGGVQGKLPSELGQNGTIYFKTSSVPPYVVGTSVVALTNEHVDKIRITFSAPINSSTFAIDDIKIQDPDLGSFFVSSITQVSATEFDLNFSPALASGKYVLEVSQQITGESGLLLDQNKNLIGGEAEDFYTVEFSVDVTPPEATVLDTYPLITTSAIQLIGGTKEAGAKVVVNGNVVVYENSSTHWSYQAYLSPGINALSIVLIDKAGNPSVPTIAEINFDNTPPGPVSVTVNPNGNGKQLHLDWGGYDTAANGNDIASYRVYASTSNFTSVSGLHPVQTLSYNLKYVTLNNLLRDQIYYIAVVAEDRVGLYSTAVNTIAVTSVDSQAPTGMGNLTVSPTTNSLLISWTKANNVDADLAAYRIGYSDQEQSKTITLNQSEVGNANPVTYELKGLAPATAHNILVSAVDLTGNTSAPLTDPGITLLTNPQQVMAVSLAASAEITWSTVAPHSLVKHYAVYTSTNLFSSVAGMTPKIVSKGFSGQTTISTTLTGLVNGTKVYVAVTAVNNSNGELKEVTPVAVTPQNDTEGPTITSADFISGANTQVLDSSPVLAQVGKFAVKATDKSKISRVVFTLNDDVLGNVLITNAQGAYEQALDLTSVADGVYSLKVDVYDMLENLTQKTYSVTVDLAAPAVPTIVAPAQNTTINQTTITLSGKSVADTQVAIANNGIDVIANVPVDSSGNYSTTIDLQEGDNLLTVKAQYVGRIKWSSYSTDRKIIVNTQIPDAPTGVNATAAKQGQIHVTWNAVTSSNANNQVKGYNIYRATSVFTGKGGAGVSKVNSQPVTNNAFSNLVVNDGTYFYAVAAVNQANNEGALSSVVSAVADSIGPKIIQLAYTSDGPVDAVSGRMGKGRVSIVATFSEPLRNSPYFAIVPEQGLPISIDLAKSYSDEKIYSGQFTIDQSTGSGTAYVSMSAHDNFGNRGTDILQGSSLLIDAQGPDLSQLTIAPVEPLKVDATNGLLVNASIRLSEPLKPATQTKLVPLLNGVAVAGYEQGILLNAANDPLAFTGEFSLPHTAAQSAMATLSFAHQAEDDLGNISQKIIGQNQFQVYQGDLPPLDIPGDLTATALPGGKVKLRWRAVEKAAGYVLYRQGPSDSTLIALEPITAIEFEDQTTVDGTYLYAVASVRRDNDQESQSAKTQTVSVKADRIAPAKPTSLALELNGAGIVSRWAAPVVDAQGAPQSQQGLTYNLYRTALAQGQNVSDYSVYTPIQTRIPTLIALDTTPSIDEHSYFVTAVDAAGNQSVASDTVYLNFGLLPVSQLHITLDKNSYPVLSWQHQGNGIESYRVLRRLGENAPQLLTPEAIAHTSTTTTYTDTSYNGNQASNGAHQEVVYSVVAVDEFNVESLGHELLLPALSVSLEKTKPVLLERGVMNQLLFHVDNKGVTAANSLRLFITLTENGRQRIHQSEFFSVAAGANTVVPIVVGGYDKLDAITDLSLRLEQKPQTNQSITIKQSESVEVGSSSLTVDLLTQDFTRGGVGKVTFTITNNSDVETELVMATNNSKTDSTDVRLILEDLQGNLLAQKAIRQTAGGVINVPSGHTVARIPAKETFTSGELTINVPAAAPDQVRLRLVIDKYHYQLGKENHVAISGVGTSKEVQLSDTPYYAQVTNVQPLTVNSKSGSVTITGKAIDRATNQPLANAPVSIVTVVRGFERTSTVYSDTNGNFILVYKLDGTAGKYRVSAIHPEMTDRPNHGEFTAEGGSVSPADIDMNVPRNYVQKIYLRVRADQETNLSNVRLVQLPNGMQQVAELPTGVTVNYQPVATIAANTYKDLTLNFSGDNTAADSGIVTYRVEADGHTGPNALGTTTLVYKLSPAAPAIKTKPTFIEAGVALDQTVYEDVVVTNSGLDLLRNAQVELQMQDASPVPAWISLSTAASLGDIPVGETRAVQIVASPSAGITDGIYELILKIKGDNLSAYTVPVVIRVTQSGIGNAFFTVSDIYTLTLDANKQVIEGVNNARVQLQNESTLTIATPKNTDAKGEVIFEGLPAGRYSYRVTANDHNSVSGRVWVKADVTSREKVFLMNNVVNVEWSVREITIEDRYEIKLEATFKTNVPAPVVILKPMAVNLPVMKKGDVFQGEFTLTNHGLIRAYDLIQSLPATNDMVRFDLLKEIPGALEPGQVFTLPYRMQALRDFNPASEAAATGGGCGSYSAAYAVSYKGKCVNDAVVTSQASAHFNSNWGSCGGGGGSSGGGGGGLGGGYGGGGGVSYSYGGSPISAEPMWCIADTECDDCNKGNGSGK